MSHKLLCKSFLTFCLSISYCNTHAMKKIKHMAHDFFLKHGTDDQKIHILNYNGYLNPNSNALYRAYKNKNLKKMKKLLPYCANDIINYRFKLNSHCPIKYHTIFEQAFLKIGFNPHSRYSKKRKIRKYESNQKFQINVFKLLLPHCHPVIRDGLLHKAAKYTPQLVEFIIDQYSMNKKNKFGQTPLSYACQYDFSRFKNNDVYFAKIFLPYCTTKTITRKYTKACYRCVKNKKNKKTLLDWAYEYDRPEIVTMLTPYFFPYLSDTLLEWAFEQALLEENVDKFRTYAYLEIIELLVTYGTQVKPEHTESIEIMHAIMLSKKDDSYEEHFANWEYLKNILNAIENTIKLIKKIKPRLQTALEKQKLADIDIQERTEFVKNDKIMEQTHATIKTKNTKVFVPLALLFLNIKMVKLNSL